MELDETALAIQPSLHLGRLTTLRAIIPLLHHSIKFASILFRKSSHLKKIVF